MADAYSTIKATEESAADKQLEEQVADATWRAYVKGGTPRLKGWELLGPILFNGKLVAGDRCDFREARDRDPSLL